MHVRRRASGYGGCAGTQTTEDRDRHRREREYRSQSLRRRPMESCCLCDYPFRSRNLNDICSRCFHAAQEILLLSQRLDTEEVKKREDGKESDPSRTRNLTRNQFKVCRFSFFNPSACWYLFASKFHEFPPKRVILLTLTAYII